jgi:hypothetical protein
MASSPDSPPRLRIVAAAITPRNRSSLLGRAQLSLVEHAVCPLDARASLAGPYIHESRYWYFDANHHRKEARVHVACPEGLSSTDEFYLWGLLSLTFAQPKPSADFYATPYYCLCQLGCVDHNEDRSGTQNYTLFRAAVSRLATVSYGPQAARYAPAVAPRWASRPGAGERATRGGPGPVLGQQAAHG